MIIPILFFIFTIGLIIASFMAFIYSLMCFGYSGTSVDKIVGLIIAWLFGPFYWIYYSYNSNYCRTNTNTNKKTNKETNTNKKL